jgi:hypothetical protein
LDGAIFGAAAAGVTAGGNFFDDEFFGAGMMNGYAVTADAGTLDARFIHYQ